jgi:metallophosphoesterase (TIGR00282 family)
MTTLRIVMLGDIVGRPGRQAVAQQMATIRQRYQPDLVIANAENAANGSGLTPELYRKLCQAGVDGMTLGDHIYKKQQIVTVLEQESNITRPANLPAGAKGKRWMKLQSPRGSIYVVTLLGRIFMNLPAADPFVTIDEILATLPEKDAIVLVEIHAEATSEKQAMGWYLNGRVAAVVGTHTHVATADTRILAPQAGPSAQQKAGGMLTGTAYMTDLGMCGPQESVLGRQIAPVLTHMTTSMPAPFDVAEGDPRVCGIFVEIDLKTRLACAVERIELAADPTKPPFTAV